MSKKYRGSLCPICGRYYCDHTAQERGQTDDEAFNTPMTDEEIVALKSGDSNLKLEVARKKSSLKKSNQLKEK